MVSLGWMNPLVALEWCGKGVLSTYKTPTFLARGSVSMFAAPSPLSVVTHPVAMMLAGS